MVDCLPRNSRLRRQSKRLTGVRIAVELREVAAGDIDANAMAGKEDVAGADQVDGQLVDPSGLQRNWPRWALAIAGSQNAFAHVDGAAVGKDVDEFGDEIGVGRVGGRM